MCGIAGAMRRGGKAVEQSWLDAMDKALAHRGPDGTGFHRQDSIGFMHRRLAIIDLVTGDQPLFGPDGLVLIANGEIYNNPELRAGMTDIPFRTLSDCEPPLTLYRRHGPDFVGSLRGMYAIALYDPGPRRLILCRDPFGIKPLYYAETAEAFLFASEPQAILATGLVTPQVDRAARDELLNLQFTTGRQTIFQGIERVLPGETLVIEDGKLAARRCREALPLSTPQGWNEDKALTELDGRLDDAVTVHQRSDVPYGMFLSGGIDSAALLALMARLNSRPVLAFTAHFPGTGAPDETGLAGKLARKLGAEHVEIPFGEEDFWRMLPGIAAAMDDPAADYAILPTAKLAEAARHSVKVVLSGEGGDELFAGYGRYRSARRIWPFARPMRRKGVLAELGILRDPASAWRDGMRRSERHYAGGAMTRLQIAQAVDCADWLPNDLLAKLDRCLMAYGIEGRVPFLDPVVAEFAFRLPDRLKIGRGLGKILLRRWLERTLPEAEPFSRKRGFTVPVEHWLAGRPELGKLLAAQPAIQALCRPGSVEDLFARLDKRSGFAAWMLLFYALWHRSRIEGQSNAGSVFDILGDQP